MQRHIAGACWFAQHASKHIEHASHAHNCFVSYALCLHSSKQVMQLQLVKLELGPAAGGTLSAWYRLP